MVVGILLGKGAERLLDLRRRRDKEIDMVFALHAEISAGRSAVGEQNEPKNIAHIEEEDFPAGPADRTDFVFEGLKGDLTSLPQQVIHPIILYYRLAAQSNLMIEFLASDGYAKLSASKRHRFRRNIIDGLRDQQSSADQALDALEEFITTCRLTLPARSRVRSDKGADGTDHLRSS